MNNNIQSDLRLIPGIDQIIEDLKKEDINITEGIKRIARNIIANLRNEIQIGSFEGSLQPSSVRQFVVSEIIKSLSPCLRRVINATGVILHTNLGRAALSQRAREEIANTASAYCNLEVDLISGERDSRQLRIRSLLSALTGAESALVVNNNAAAVLLILDTFARSQEVIVSRGELVEIGGSFRVPEIMLKSGAILKEVGTTNRTRISDYRDKINESTSILMKVHPSNFHIYGFTEEVSIKSLSELGKQHNKLVYYDLGSSALDPLMKEEAIEELVSMDIDLISFSGDKLLGGPQAGIILGKKDLITRLNANNLHRALRIDKLTLCALEVTLRQYLMGEKMEIPTFRMFSLTEEELNIRTSNLINTLSKEVDTPFQFTLGQGFSLVGGGSLPEETIPGPILVIDGSHTSITKVHKKLREVEPAIITHLQQGHLELNLRTVAPEEEPLLLEQLIAVLNSETTF